MKTVDRLLLTMIFVAGGLGISTAAELGNGRLSLKLGDTPGRVSGIEAAAWMPEGRVVFRSAADEAGINEWLAKVLPGAGKGVAGAWKVENDADFERACCRTKYDGLLVTRNIELAKSGTTFRMFTSLKNTGTGDLRVERFPVWKGRWNLGPDKPTLDWCESLTFKPHRAELQPGQGVKLESKTYSSQRSKDGRGHVPFWNLKAGRRYLFISLAWCGGWQAEFEQSDAGTGIEIALPAEETQLVLKPGEEIRGPMVYVTAVEADSEEAAREKWLGQRGALAAKLYGGPKPWCPLVYNHWYAVRTECSVAFLEGQLAVMKQWGVFDVFVLDYGWFDKVGDWRPAKSKYRPGELESFYSRLQKEGIKPGIWSCPWLRAVDKGKFGPEIDEPRFYRGFMDAYSLDLAGMDFSRLMVDHIAELKKQFQVEWWKYDQELFGEGGRQGKMKKVAALQDALVAVRLAYPELYIEDCMSGGRMINMLTDNISQGHWIRDGKHTGHDHTNSNVREALGAASFLPLAKIQRWINRPNESDSADEESLKAYCRSAMIGTWGISCDLPKLDAGHRRVILAEVERYRRLNDFKTTNRYRILQPDDPQSKVAGIVLYDLPKKRAAVLLFRWQEQGEIAERICLDALPKQGRYSVTDADTGKTQVFTAAELRESGLPVTFEPARRSGIFWVESEK